MVSVHRPLPPKRLRRTTGRAPPSGSVITILGLLQLLLSIKQQVFPHTSSENIEHLEDVEIFRLAYHLHRHKARTDAAEDDPTV